MIIYFIGDVLVEGNSSLTPAVIMIWNIYSLIRIYIMDIGWSSIINIIYYK